MSGPGPFYVIGTSSFIACTTRPRRSNSYAAAIRFSVEYRKISAQP